MPLLDGLRAVAEPTRLNIVAIIDSCELNVGELTRVLAQSQPRVSRHLKILCDAGLLKRHQEGASALFSVATTGVGGELVRALRPLYEWPQNDLHKAMERLEVLRKSRAHKAEQHFDQLASDWDAFRDVTVGETVVEERLLQLFNAPQVHDFLDLGTGTGRMLELFSERFERGLGIDVSADMLRVARAKMDQPNLRHCRVRKGNLYDLDVPAGAADVTVLHHVLHYLDDPGLAIAEAARTLRPSGQLLIVDFAPHTFDSLRTVHAHRRLGFSDQEIAAWCEDAGLEGLRIEHLQSSAETGGERLVVTIWIARQTLTAPSHHQLEVA